MKTWPQPRVEKFTSKQCVDRLVILRALIFTFTDKSWLMIIFQNCSPWRMQTVTDRTEAEWGGRRSAEDGSIHSQRMLFVWSDIWQINRERREVSPLAGWDSGMGLQLTLCTQAHYPGATRIILCALYLTLVVDWHHSKFPHPPSSHTVLWMLIEHPGWMNIYWEFWLWTANQPSKAVRHNKSWLGYFQKGSCFS